jgi:hypothetical protein
VAGCLTQDRPDVAARRAAWRDGQAALDPGRLKFVDETWASTNMARRYGRAPAGERLVGAVPQGHWQTTTFVAALSVDGLTAPLVIDGAMTGDLFVAYVEQVLVPALAAGDVVVMDNLSSHKRARVWARIEGAGCTLLYRTSTRSNWPSPSSRRCCTSGAADSGGVVGVPRPGAGRLQSTGVSQLLPPLRLPRYT